MTGKVFTHIPEEGKANTLNNTFTLGVSESKEKINNLRFVLRIAFAENTVFTNVLLLNSGSK